MPPTFAPGVSLRRVGKCNVTSSSEGGGPQNPYATYFYSGTACPVNEKTSEQLKVNNGWNNNSLTSNQRTSLLAKQTIRGRAIMFGNHGVPLQFNYYGGVNGHPGSGAPNPRNR